MALARLGSAWKPLIESALGEGVFRSGEDPSAVIDALVTYLDELAAWNARTDLTAARGPEEAVDLMLADAALLARHGDVESRTATWVDVGTGAGAPGLVLALLRPRWPMTLVEPKDRRVAFLRSVIGRLGLSTVRVVRGRSEALPPRSSEVAVSRATLAPAEWLREGARLSRRAVWVLLAKEEPPALPGFQIARDLSYEWPLTHVPRRAVCFVPDAER